MPTGPILSESRPVRLFTFFLLYFGQGLPVGTATVGFTAWLAANGAPEADVAAIVAAAYLPWSFKFIPAAVMDRYAWLPMGRRRAWLIASQALMIAGFAIAALIGPGPEDIQVILYIVFLIGTGSAIQDVAVDGLAVDILPEREQGTASAFMFGGQAVGIAVSGAAAGAGLQYLGSSTTFLLFLPVILIVTLWALIIKERPEEKRLPWSRGKASPVNLERHVGAWWPIAEATFRSMIKPDSLKLLGAALLTRTAGGMITAMWPIIAVVGAGYTSAGFGAMFSTAKLAMAVAAIAIGSLLTMRLGPRIATMLVYLSLALLVLFILYGGSIWVGTVAFIVVSCLWALHDTVSSIVSNPLRMQLSDPNVAATQFTIYNSLSNLPVSLGATLYAIFGGTEELAQVVWTMVALLVAGSAVYGWMRIGSRHVEAEPVPVVN